MHMCACTHNIIHVVDKILKVAYVVAKKSAQLEHSCLFISDSVTSFTHSVLQGWYQALE